MALDLAYDVTGDGEPLVVLHGLFGSARNWRGIAKKLSAQRRVYSLDLRNHGDSPWDDDMSYPAMAEDLRGFLDRHDIAGSAVLGHSMGGKAAMALALLYPDMVSTLLVADVAPVQYDVGLRDYARAMANVDLSAARRRADVDRRLAPAIPEKGIRAFLLQNVVERDGGLVWRLNLAVLDRQMEAIAGFPDVLAECRYDGPVHFIAGGNSRYIRPEHRERILSLFPAASYAVIAGAGHWLHAERPDAFLRAVERFLDR